MADTNVTIPGAAAIPARKTTEVTTENAMSGVKAVSGNHASSTYPDGFVWPFSGGVWDDFKAIKNGDSYECSVKPEDLIDLSTYTNVIYVNVNNASAGDGSSWANALKGIDEAVTLAISAGVATKIMIHAGNYVRQYSMGKTGTRHLTAPIALIGVYGEVHTGIFDPQTWVQNDTYSNVYETPRSSTVNCVNPSLLNENGDFADYIYVDSLALCASTQGSWYTDNVTVYINSHTGGSVSNANARVFIGTSGATFSGNHDVYLYNMHYEHGYSASVRFVGGTDNTIVFHNSSAKYATSGTTYAGAIPVDGISVQGCGLFAGFNSVASSNSKDGFNIHSEGGVIPSCLTVNCVGKSNGKRIKTSQSNNGITTHDGIKNIDIGGVYLGSVGTNVGCIDEGTQVWCFGTVAGNSDGDFINGGGIGHGAFGMWVDSNEMWLENTTDVGSSIGVYAGSESSVYLRNHNGMGKQVASSGGVIDDF